MNGDDRHDFRTPLTVVFVHSLGMQWVKKEMQVLISEQLTEDCASVRGFDWVLSEFALKMEEDCCSMAEGCPSA